MRRTSKKILRILRAVTVAVILAALLLCAAVFIINRKMMTAAESRILTENEAVSKGADCILVLGAGVWDGGVPSHMLSDRLDEAISLYKLGASDKLLMSGDHGSTDYDEVNVMKRYAIEAGVPSENVFMDHAGFSTYESLYRARDVFKAERIIIVTQIESIIILVEFQIVAIVNNCVIDGVNRIWNNKFLQVFLKLEQSSIL